MQLLCLLFICQSAMLQQQTKSMGSLSHESNDEQHYSNQNYNNDHNDDDDDYSVDADNNQSGEELVANAKQRPAVQVKVTNEVESASSMMRAEKQKLPLLLQPNGNGNGSGNGHDNDKTDTQNAMFSMQDGDEDDDDASNLMSPNMLPILERHNSDNADIDGQMVADEQLLRLQDYNLLYNAERQTYFQLHTSTSTSSNPLSMQDNLMGQATSGNRLLQRVVGNTLSAAFGLNANSGQHSMTMTTQTVRLYDANSLRQSNYNPFNPTRVIIHGWLGNAHANIYSYLVPAYLNLDEGNYNIFTVDWGRGAIADYITASYRVKPVGQVLAKFLDFLHEEAGMRYEDLQLIGFSMGAHVAGLAAKHVQTGRVRVIRALDPALPFFRYAQEKERLTKQDADYVEVLHTSVGSYGFDRPLGHVDFYANWGSQQPGCFWHECSHWRAFDLFKESLQSNDGIALFEAKGCQPTDWQQLTRYKRCPQPTGFQLNMGGDLGDLSMDQLAQRKGVYYFETNGKAPYNIKAPTYGMRGG